MTWIFINWDLHQETHVKSLRHKQVAGIIVCQVTSIIYGTLWIFNSLRTGTWPTVGEVATHHNVGNPGRHKPTITGDGSEKP